jgi:hypothetical protein
MTIEQTIEVPVNHRIFLDLPPQVPVGKAKLEFTVIPEAAPKSGKRSGFGCAKGEFIVAEDFDEPLEDFKEYM